MDARVFYNLVGLKALEVVVGRFGARTVAAGGPLAPQARKNTELNHETEIPIKKMTTGLHLLETVHRAPQAKIFLKHPDLSIKNCVFIAFIPKFSPAAALRAAAGCLLTSPLLLPAVPSFVVQTRFKVKGVGPVY